MINKPLISVIMSVCGERESFLRDSMDSILNQTFEAFEFLIAIDGRKENKETINILQKYAVKDKRIKLIYLKKNKGLTKALNILLKKARGKYIVRMDADDVSHEYRLQIQYAFMENNKLLDFSGFRVEFIDGEGTEIDRLTTYKFESNWMIRLMHKHINQFIHPSLIIRKSALDVFDITYNEDYKYAQDYELTMRLIYKYGLITGNLPEKLLKYRITESRISVSKREEQKMYGKKIKRLFK